MKKLWSKYLIVIAPLLIAAYMLYPTYRYSELIAERDALAGDSLALDEWENENLKALETARNQRLKLGLDLRGGMYVTLEVDVVRLIEESADPLSVDETFQSVIEKTRHETMVSDANVIDVFLKHFRATGKSLLAYFTLGAVSDPTEEAIEAKLRRDTDGAIDQAVEVIRQRIDKYNVAEVNIQKQGARRLVIELPDVKDEKEIRSLIQTTARLDFRRVLSDKQLIRSFHMIDKMLSSSGVKTDTTGESADATTADTSSAAAVSASDTSSTDTAVAANGATSDDSAQKDPYEGLSDEEKVRRYRQDHPFTSLFETYFINNNQTVPVAYVEDNYPDGDYSFYITERYVRRFNEMLQRPDVRAVLPADRVVMLAAKSEKRIAEQQGINIFRFYGLSRESELTGDVIVDAWESFDPTNNQPMVMMNMNTEGSERWGRITGANIGKQIAIVLDDRVYSAPVVQNKITGGSSQITGMDSPAEANLLSVVLKAGALKAPVQIIEERVVGPSLGEDSIRRGMISSIISFAFVILFMLVYYMLGGAVADLALLLNGVLIIGLMAGFGFTLTLPGIAGIILSVAMAVDANILVFERIREELAMGRALKAAVDAGYSKAMSAIIDSNVTNILSGIVLWQFGTGPVQGFALALVIGVLTTLFTAVVVSRKMFEIIIGSGATSLNFGQKKLPIA